LNKTEKYQQILPDLKNWEPYLLAESGLPGPRTNLELVQVVADMGDQALFDRLLAYGPTEAPVNTPAEFLALCGVVGLGQLLAAGQTSELDRLQEYANDPRWRMREGVCAVPPRSAQRASLRRTDFASGKRDHCNYPGRTRPPQ
jgi:hypothetical protein